MRRRLAILSGLTAALMTMVAAPVPAAAADPPWATTRLTNSQVDTLPCAGADALGYSYIAFSRWGHLPGIWLSTNRSGSWRTSRLTSVPGDTCASLALDPGRHVHILVSRAGGGLVYLNNASGAWRSRTMASNAWPASVAVDRSGRVAIAYGIGSAGIVVASNRSGVWRWTRPTRAQVIAQSRVAIDTAGRVWLAYETSGGIFVANYAAGVWRNRLLDRSGRAGTVDLGIDAYGRVSVAFQRTWGTVYVRTLVSGTWRATTSFQTTAHLQSLGVTRAGRFHFLLETAAGDVLDRTNRSGVWRTSRLARGASGSVLALDPAGHLTAAWASNGTVVATDRSGSLRTRRLTSDSVDRVLAVVADTDGHRYVMIERSGVAHRTLLATDRAGAWAITALPVSATQVAISIDASGNPLVAYVAGAGAGVARQVAGAWVTTALPTVDGVLLVIPDAVRGDRVVATVGLDVVVVRSGAGGWAVESTAPGAGTCNRAAVDTAGIVHVACQSTAGLTMWTLTSGTWASSVVAGPHPAGADYVIAERVAVDASGMRSVAFLEALNETGPDAGLVRVASAASGPWVTASPGVSSFVGAVDLALDPAGHRHLLTGGAGLTETTDASGSWVSGSVPVGLGPTTGRLLFDAAGRETVVATLGDLAIAEGVSGLRDAGVVILTR